MPALKPITIGTRFSRLTTLTANSRGIRYCECVCECGNRVLVDSGRLRSGNTKSCGCLSKQKLGLLARTHGLSSTPTYRSWLNMLSRCRYSYFETHYGRGISVCDRWRSSFANFLADMGERPNGCSIDRIDNSKNYGPDNCRWATRKVQNRNTRQNRMVAYRGETKCLSEWCEVLNLQPGAIKQRLNKLGWPVEKAFNTPVRKLSRQRPSTPGAPPGG